MFKQVNLIKGKLMIGMIFSFLFVFSGQSADVESSWLADSRIHGHTRLSYPHVDLEGFYMLGARAHDLNIKTLTRHVKTGQEDPWWEWDAFAEAPPAETGFTSNDTVEIVQDMFHEPAAHGVNTIAYYWLGSDAGALAAHPEWANLDIDGNPQSHDSRGELVDIVNTGYQDLVISRLKTLASYGAKGVYFDSRHGNYEGCFGSASESSYTGTVPSSMDLSNPDYQAYLAYNAKMTAQAINRIVNEVNASYPDFRFIISCTELCTLAHPLMDGKLASAADAPKIEFRLPVLHGLFQEQIWQDMRDNGIYTPINSRLTYSYNMLRTASRGLPHIWGRWFMSWAQYRAFVLGMIANGCIANVDLNDNFMMGRVSNCYNLTETQVQTLFAFGNQISAPLKGMSPVKYAAVYHSENVRDSYGVNYLNAWQEAVAPQQLVYLELMKRAVPVDVLCDVNVKSEYLSSYKYIFVVQRNRLAGVHESALAAFEASGGQVIEIDTDNPRALSPSTMADIQAVTDASPVHLTSAGEMISATTFTTASGDRKCFYISNDLSWLQEDSDGDIREFNDWTVQITPDGVIHDPPAIVRGIDLFVASSTMPRQILNHYDSSSVGFTAVPGGFEVDIPNFVVGACLEIIY